MKGKETIFVNHQYKQVIVIRQDLKMSTGKKVAQACHASVTSVNKARIHFPSIYKSWINEGQKKVALKIQSQEELEKIFYQAVDQKLPCCIIQDAGLTQLEPGTITAVGIGPAKAIIIDKITGNLKLL
jgi:peptidyl-tRNA hydrolase, PTH2 family